MSPRSAAPEWAVGAGRKRHGSRVCDPDLSASWKKSPHTALLSLLKPDFKITVTFHVVFRSLSKCGFRGFALHFEGPCRGPFSVSASEQLLSSSVK